MELEDLVVAELALALEMLDAFHKTLQEHREPRKVFGNFLSPLLLLRIFWLGGLDQELPRPVGLDCALIHCWIAHSICVHDETLSRQGERPVIGGIRCGVCAAHLHELREAPPHIDIKFVRDRGRWTDIERDVVWRRCLCSEGNRLTFGKETEQCGKRVDDVVDSGGRGTLAGLERPGGSYRVPP